MVDELGVGEEAAAADAAEVGWDTGGFRSLEAIGSTAFGASGTDGGREVAKGVVVGVGDGEA